MECERSGSWEMHFFFSDTRPLDYTAAGGLRSVLAVLEWLKSGLRKGKLVPGRTVIFFIRPYVQLTEPEVLNTVGKMD